MHHISTAYPCCFTEIYIHWLAAPHFPLPHPLPCFDANSDVCQQSHLASAAVPSSATITSRVKVCTQPSSRQQSSGELLSRDVHPPVSAGNGNLTEELFLLCSQGIWSLFQPFPDNGFLAPCPFVSGVAGGAGSFQHTSAQVSWPACFPIGKWPQRGWNHGSAGAPLKASTDANDSGTLSSEGWLSRPCSHLPLASFYDDRNGWQESSAAGVHDSGWDLTPGGPGPVVYDFHSPLLSTFCVDETLTQLGHFWESIKQK